MTIINDRNLKEIWVTCDGCPDIDGPFDSFRELFDETPFRVEQTADGEWNHFCPVCISERLQQLRI